MTNLPGAGGEAVSLPAVFRSMTRVLAHPSLGSFERERASASLGSAILIVVASGIVAGFIGGWVNVALASSGATDIIVLTVITPLRFVVGLLVAQGFLFAVARLMGGQDAFATQAYLSALVFAPLNALALFLAVVPGVGGLLALLVLGIAAWLTVPALRAAHGGQSWRVPGFVLFVFSFAAGILSWLVISTLSL